MRSHFQQGGAERRQGYANRPAFCAGDSVAMVSTGRLRCDRDNQTALGRIGSEWGKLFGNPASRLRIGTLQRRKLAVRFVGGVG